MELDEVGHKKVTNNSTYPWKGYNNRDDGAAKVQINRRSKHILGPRTPGDPILNANLANAASIPHAFIEELKWHFNEREIVVLPSTTTQVNY